VCRMFAKSGTCRFGENCTFAHAAAKAPKAPKAPKGPGQPAAPAATPAPPPPSATIPAAPAKGKGRGKKALRKACVAADAAYAEAVAAATLSAAPGVGGPVEKKHLECNYYKTTAGCHRGDACTFAHGPPGTMSPAAKAAAPIGGKGKGKGGRGYVAMIRPAYLCAQRPRMQGSPLTISSLASVEKNGHERRICFKQSDDILEIAVVGNGNKTRVQQHDPFHAHKDGRKASSERNRQASVNAIQAAWNLSYEAGTCELEWSPNAELVELMADGHDFSIDEPQPSTAAVARGVWVLDSGASDFLVGKVNLKKSELKAAKTDGPSILLSTANGVVEMNARTTQALPDTVGRTAPVEAVIMDDMDLNIASMGRLVAEQAFTSIWAPGHGHLWRDPETMTWIRLKVENFVPLLVPDEDQSGIQEALGSIFAGVELSCFAAGPPGDDGYTSLLRSRSCRSGTRSRPYGRRRARRAPYHGRPHRRPRLIVFRCRGSGRRPAGRRCRGSGHSSAGR
jgi:hypothetical protein